MVGIIEPRIDAIYGWQLGENGVNADVDSNFLKIAAFMGLSAIDRGLTTPPASPTDGDAYIIPAAATGVWNNRENQIAIYRGPPDDAWEFYDPTTFRARLLCYIEDENRLVVWNGTNWNNGVNFST